LFVDDLPQVDMVVMGNVLHDWNNDQGGLGVAEQRRALDYHRDVVDEIRGAGQQDRVGG
jgi:hypothetical protein